MSKQSIQCTRKLKLGITYLADISLIYIYIYPPKYNPNFHQIQRGQRFRRNLVHVTHSKLNNEATNENYQPLHKMVAIFIYNYSLTFICSPCIFNLYKFKFQDGTKEFTNNKPVKSEFCPPTYTQLIPLHVFPLLSYISFSLCSHSPKPV